MDVGVIDGWLYEDGVSRLSEAGNKESYARNNAGNEVEPLGMYAPTIAALLPGYDGGGPLWGAHGVTQDLVLETMTQGVEDEGRGGKVHIGHPERKEVVPTPYAGDGVDLQSIGTATVDDLVKVVLHSYKYVIC